MELDVYFLILIQELHAMYRKTKIKMYFLQVWDLERPFEGDATLQLLKFDDDEAKQVGICFHLKYFCFLKLCK